MSDAISESKQSDRAFAGAYERYITPQDTPTTYRCRRIRIPDDPAFVVALNELVSRLGFPEFWFESDGGMTPDECAALGSLMFYDFSESDGYCMLGMCVPYAGAELKPNMLWCDGGEYLLADYPDLAAVLNPALVVSATHFRTPNTNGKFVKGRDFAADDHTGDTGGEASHVLTVGEMPSHTHTQQAHNHTQVAHSHDITHSHGMFGRINATGFGNSNRMAMADMGGSNSTPSTQTQSTTLSGQTTATNNPATAVNDNTGGGAAHNNMPPWVELPYVMIVK